MSNKCALFFWKDWDSDLGLKNCSLAAQGLWMRMLCVAAQHDPIGFVAINSVGLDSHGIRTHCAPAAGSSEVEALISELSVNGVFGRDRNGVIYNRRMVRDAKKAAIARKNGKKGGNPTLCNNSEIFSSDKGQDKGQDKGRVKLEPSLIPYSVTTTLHLNRELSDQENRTKQKSISKIKKRTYSPKFEAFWTAYPTDPLMAKSKTFDEWIKLDEGDQKAASEAIPAFRAYCSKTKDYRPVHAVKFLSERRFDGYLETTKRVAAKTGVFVRRETPEWDAWVVFWRETKRGREPPSHNGGWHFPSLWPPKEREAL